MWDNRLTKRNPKAPDYKCRDRSCDGVIWPSRVATNGANAELTNVALVDHGEEANDTPF